MWAISTPFLAAHDCCESEQRKGKGGERERERERKRDRERERKRKRERGRYKLEITEMGRKIWLNNLQKCPQTRAVYVARRFLDWPFLSHSCPSSSCPFWLIFCIHSHP